MSTIIRWNPVREMAVMQNALDRLFEDTWNGIRTNNTLNSLALDIHDTDNAFLVSAAVPGMTADQLSINYHDQVLTISGETVAETREDARTLVLERAYGKFSRSIRLPQPVSIESVEANLNNGVLSLTLPKSTEAQPRNIPVRATIQNN